MTNPDTRSSLQLIKDAQKTPHDMFGKAYTQSNSPTAGFVTYSVETGAKDLTAVITPLRNDMPRALAVGGVQANWKAVTGLNIAGGGIGISQGNRGVVVATSTADYAASFKAWGLDDTVTFEADLAAQGFADVKALATQNLLKAVMIGEEKLILGGNGSLALGATPTPTLSDAATGGGLAANTALSVICVALTLDGYLAASVVGGLPLSGSRGLADGSSESYAAGTAQKSAAATVTTANDGAATHTVKASVAAVTGALGYAWFWGSAGAEALGAITTINSVAITAGAVGGQLASAGFAADHSVNPLHFDGLLTIASKGLGATVLTQPTGTAGLGTPLTADGAGGIVEIDEALRGLWDNYRLTPDTIWVSSQEMTAIATKILTGTSASAQRFSFNVDQGMIAGGVAVRSYLNKYSLDGMNTIAIRLHPNLPPGTLLMTTRTLPYPLSNVGNLMQMRMRRDYYQIEWPIRRRMYEYGVYADGVLQHYFPPSLAAITNIAKG